MGCQVDDPEAARSSRVAALGLECTDVGGLQNCAFGAATVTPGSDGTGMDVAGLRTAGQDGVATFLPATRTFTMAGTSTANQRTTEISRVINEGEVISTLTARHNAAGLALAGTFTGNDDATYDANLYKDGELVGVVPALRNAHGLQIDPGPGTPQPGLIIIIVACFDVGFYPDWFVSGQPGTPPAEVGACAWKVDLAPDRDPHVTLHDGTSVAVDHVELVENVTPAGSYPYLSFDRIDYSSNAGALHVTSETAE